MATLTVQSITKTGLTPALVAAAGGGDKFANTGKEMLEIVNGSGASITVTIVAQKTVEGLAIAGRAIAIPAGQRRFIGRISPTVFNDSQGFTNLTYSGVTSLTIGAFQFDPAS